MNFPPDTLICNPCLNAIDRDKENQQSSDYQSPTQKISNSNMNSKSSYISRNDLLYSIKEFEELETAYCKVCEEFDQIKLSM